MAAVRQAPPDFEAAFAAFVAEYQAPALAAVQSPRAEAEPEPELEAG
jgi:hypothetical protein